MFRVRQTNSFANSLASFMDDIIPQKATTPQLVTIGSSDESADVANDSLFMQRRRRVRRSRSGVSAPAVKTGWY